MSERAPLPEIVTRVGRADWGENQYCGYPVLAELVGHAGLGAALSLALGGPRLDEEQARVLDDRCISILAPDGRIWPLKIVRLVSAYGGITAAFAAAHLGLEDALVGPWVAGPAAKLLVELDAETKHEPLENTVDRRLARGDKFPGFGVLFRGEDERYVALVKCMEERGGHHWKLLRKLEAVLRDRKNLRANMVNGVAAVALDLGFTSEQVAPLCTALCDPQFWAHAVEGASQAPAVFRTRPKEFMQYAGIPPRESDRAKR